MRCVLYIARAITFVLAFAVGVLFAVLSTPLTIDIEDIEPISPPERAWEITACEMGDASRDLVNSKLSFHATVYHVDYALDDYSEDFVNIHPLPFEICYDDTYDPFITIELDLDGYSGPNSNLKFNLGPFEREVDVRVVGMVVRSRKAGIGKSKRYTVRPDIIELVSPFREFTPKGAA
jgi:hypothetical protein